MPASKVITVKVVITVSDGSTVTKAGSKASTHLLKGDLDEYALAVDALTHQLGQKIIRFWPPQFQEGATDGQAS